MKARQGRGLSRERLAALAGLSPRTIFAIEVEGVRPQRATCRVLADALGCDASALGDDGSVVNDHGSVASGPVGKEGRSVAAPPQ